LRRIGFDDNIAAVGISELAVGAGHQPCSSPGINREFNDIIVRIMTISRITPMLPRLIDAAASRPATRNDLDIGLYLTFGDFTVAESDNRISILFVAGVVGNKNNRYLELPV